MGFQDLNEFFTPGLPLPINGKTYLIPEVSAADGLRLLQLIAMNALDATTEQREALKLLGAEWTVDEVEVPTFDEATGKQAVKTVDGKQVEVTRKEKIGKWSGGLFDEMSADGLTMDQIVHAGVTSIVKAAKGMKAAEEHWAAGLAVQVERAEDSAGNPQPPAAGANRAKKRAAKKVPAKKAAQKSSSRAGTGASTTRGRARTGRTTPAAPTTTP